VGCTVTPVGSQDPSRSVLIQRQVGVQNSHKTYRLSLQNACACLCLLISLGRWPAEGYKAHKSMLSVLMLPCCWPNHALLHLCMHLCMHLYMQVRLTFPAVLLLQVPALPTGMPPSASSCAKPCFSDAMLRKGSVPSSQPACQQHQQQQQVSKGTSVPHCVCDS
jgi:hypothetical protein